jgi:hypothetical protein
MGSHALLAGNVDRAAGFLDGVGEERADLADAGGEEQASSFSSAQ